MNAPAALYRVKHAEDPLCWDWAEKQPLAACPWSPNPTPAVSVQALWRKDALFVRLCSDEPPSRAVNRDEDSPVWEDSCLECFFGTGGEDYVNLEGNANGALLAAVGPDRNRRRFLAGQGYPRPRLRCLSCGRGWEAVFTVPAETLSALFGLTLSEGLRLRANFYCCGDRTPRPCYAAWARVLTPTPDFHRPEFFGTLILDR